jgi:feruloyl esterase
MKIIASVACGILLGGIVYLGGSARAQRPSGPPSGRPSVDAVACARLASLTLPHTTVASAQVIPAGQFKPPAGAAEGFADLAAFCRVAITIAPSRDSDIKSEVWLPLSGWNGKFQMVGNGGWNGTIQYGALAAALRRGYAASSTDTGHVGGSASFALGHPEKLTDFGYRAVHETALQSKATIAALYNAAPRLSYFNGCSGGGRQAFMEAQRFPEDFDAILAGAPGYGRTDESFQHVAAYQAVTKDAASWITPEKYPVLHQAALDACDAGDGVKDGLISDPLRCKFDPAVTQCKGPDAPNCLTPAQVQAAKKIYAPLVDPRTGQEIFPGFEPGSELRWGGTTGGPAPSLLSNDLFKYVVFKDPNWDFRTLDVSRHLDMARKIDNGDLSPTSANIQAFVGRGGKFLIYHGWGDQNVAPQHSTQYYDRLVAAMGKSRVEDSVRVYMVPGMGHCGGGEGPNVFDALGALDQWREQGIAPKEIIASRIENGVVTRTRPLCPYPQLAQYKGTGSTDQAENFVCRLP